MMKRNFLSKLFQASLMCCLAVILTGCDDMFGSEDNPIPAYLSMDASDVTLKVGETKTRTAIAVSTAIVEYSSSDPAIATVDANGTVTGVAEGTATITATATGYSSASGKKMFVEEKKSYKVTVEGVPAPAPALTMLQTPLTLEAAEAGAKVTFTIKVATGVEYSTDGENWSPYTSATPITLAAIGDKVSFRGTNAAYADNSNYSNISCDKDCYIYGNIMSLIKANGFENETTLTADYTFEYLFFDNAKIKNHTDATKYLVLPATEITAHCYRYMFYACTSLTTAPELPATTLAERCYYYMFRDCGALTTAPELPATEMKDYCYSGMFNSCNTLTTAPELPATTLANYCYKSMFEGCTSLTAAPKLPATTLISGCYNSMFYDCTSLAEAWVKAGYNVSCNYMFKGCATGGVLHTDGTGWAADTNLPTGWTTIAYNAVVAKSTPFTIEALEDGATVTFKALNSAPARDIQYSTDGGATWTDGNTGGTGVSVVLANVGDKVSFRGETTYYATDGNNDYNHIDCDKNIKVYGNIMSLIQKTGFETLTALTGTNTFKKLFRNNTKLIDASDLLLPAETLTDFCYNNMFNGCTNLTAAPKELPATTVAEDCYSSMFQGCTNLTTVPVELPAAVMKEYCYSSMFYGCTSLTTAPKLPATTLVNRCYSFMFNGCTSLNEVWVKAGYNGGACNNMFNGCTNASTSTFHTDGDWSSWTAAFPNINTWTNEDYTPAP